MDVARFPLQENKEDFLITVSRLVPYKKVDLIAAACAQAGKRPAVVGEGPELPKVMAFHGKKLRFWDTSRIAWVVDLVRRAQGFIFAAREEFGIVAGGGPGPPNQVIAFGAGGSLETVQGVFPGDRPRPNTTGVFFRGTDAAFHPRGPYVV